MNQELNHILKGCRKGDRESQHSLYKLFYPYGMSVCIRYVKDEGEAMSILNDGFMKVFTKIHLYNDDYDFKPWFRKLVVNTAIDHLKKQKKLLMETEINESTDLPDKETILSKIGYDELVAMVQTLSHAYRTVFNMYVIDGFKHEEIANELNITVGTSKSNLFKARAALQKLIKKQITVSHV